MMLIGHFCFSRIFLVLFSQVLLQYHTAVRSEMKKVLLPYAMLKIDCNTRPLLKQSGHTGYQIVYKK